MSEKPELTGTPVEREIPQAEMHINEYGSTKDPAVVVEEPERTVLLTNDETVVFEKPRQIEVAPANRSRRVYGGMWGNAEIGAVGIASVALLAALLLYLFAVVPSNREMEKNLAESDRLQSELTSANNKYGGITSTQSRVTDLLTSVNDFELNHLPIAAVGRNALYQRINGLIAAYGLINTTGPDYIPLDTVDQNSGPQTDEERGRAKFRSLFPGVYVTMTLDGPYQNLRRFINDVERGSDFIVISSIELEPSDSESHQTSSSTQNQSTRVQPMSPNMPQGFSGAVNPTTGRPMTQSQQMQSVQPQAAAPRGKTHGETVSLRLELAAYFRRPGFVPVETSPAKSGTKGGVQ
jgi:hypothetical protein